MEIEIPKRIRKMPRDSRGYVVPYFVAWIDGEPNFAVSDPEKWMDCVRFEKCWLCGEKLGRYKTFVIGPMCLLNRNTAEPPCHHDCALYAVKTCPFLSKPRMGRVPDDKIPEGSSMPGIGIKRNPGVTATWTTDSFKVWKDHNGGPLIRIGDATSVEFWREGRLATKDEVVESVDSGLPLLLQVANGEKEEAVIHERRNTFVKSLTI